MRFKREERELGESFTPTVDERYGGAIGVAVIAIVIVALIVLGIVDSLHYLSVN